MSSKETVVVLYSELPEGAALDELDTIIQADLVTASLEKLGYQTVRLPFSIDLKSFTENLRIAAPVFIFNLVESVDGAGSLCHFAPFLMEHLQIKYSGCPAEAIYLTTNKLLTKRLLSLSGVNTPGWVSLNEIIDYKPGSQYIIKPVSEDASIGLEADFLIKSESPDDLRKTIIKKQKLFAKEFFAEEYIDGREMSISMLGQGGEPEILPAAEIRFIGYQETGRVKVVDYKAKWDEDSFEYQNTQRSFDFEGIDLPMLDDMKAIARSCWNCFRLKGYARVDFRVDQNGKPWVLEVNSNPCLTPGSGLMAAGEKIGLAFTDLIGRIIKEI